MKAIYSQVAILVGALLVTMESGVAIAKSRHHIPGEAPHGSKSLDEAQKPARAPGAAVTSNPGTGNTNGALSAGAADKGGRNSSTPVGDGSMKKGDNLPGKVGPRNSGAVESGKNQVGDRGDINHHDHDAVHPGKSSSTDTGKSENVIADGPGHKTKKPAEATKKIMTIFRPHLVKDHPSGPAKIERNAIGVAIRNDGSPKSGLDPKVGANGTSAPAGLPGPTVTRSIANAVPTTNAVPPIGHSGQSAVDSPPRTGPIISGTSVSRPGSSLASVGGPTKNTVGALSGNSFRPKHP